MSEKGMYMAACYILATSKNCELLDWAERVARKIEDGKEG